MIGLRLRKENIQIGDENTLQKFFKDYRGQHYFVGEIFAVSHDLIPNSQRDYFNENSCRVEFEGELRKYFRELQQNYYEGSKINSAFDKIDSLAKKELEHEQKMQTGGYINNEQIIIAEQNLERVRQEAEKAREEIERRKAKAQNNPNSATLKIIDRNEQQRANREIQDKEQVNTAEQKSKPVYMTDTLSEYNKKERKLISKIFEIIYSVTDRKTAENIILEIREKL